MKEKRVDVIIPTYKPDHIFQQLIKRLAVQSYPVAHIWIMNTDKQYWDSVYEKLTDNMKVIHLIKEEFDHGGTRNRAARISEADILIYMTQDALPQNNHLIEELVKAFDEPSVKAVYGRQLPQKDCNIIERYTRSFNYPKESRVKRKEDLQELGIKTFFCSNVCAAYERKIYEELGGFVTHTIFNEDMIFAGKLIQEGYGVAYAADARVIHSHNYSNIQQMKRNFDLGVSQADHPEIFEGIRSEGEGVRLVKKTASYLLRKRKPWLLFSLVIKSGCKYIGYYLGKHYKNFPHGIILKLTMDQSYWNNTIKR